MRKGLVLKYVPSRRKVGAICASLLCLSLLSALVSREVYAQKADKPAVRKIVTQVQAQYPPDLKRALIGGTVRLDIIVTPKGTVDFVQIAGGNPILADAATRAVKQWKYSPSPTSTNIRVNISFDPTR